MNTATLPPLSSFVPPRTMEDLFNQTASRAGYNAVSTYLGCPERARLRAMKVRRKPRAFVEGTPLDSRDYGSLIHALLATRIAFGQERAERLLKPVDEGGLALVAEDRIKATSVLRIYHAEYGPPEGEPFRYLSVEAEVVTDVGPNGHPIERTARFDAVIQQDDPVRGRVVYSLEKKTDSKGGHGAMAAYLPQAMVQATVWNRNRALVEQYGPMAGVIFDVIVKTTVPRMERLAPKFISKYQLDRAVEYLRLPEVVRYPVLADGRYPAMLHACWGRYSPCEFTGLCLEGSRGDYLFPEDGR